MKTKQYIQKLIDALKFLFTPSEKHQGIWPIKVYVLKLFFALMFVLVAKEAWMELLTHQGAWKNEIAVAWCSIAAYTTLAGLGIFHTLRMLPIMIFMIFYKVLWLFFVAYPLWTAGQLAGSEADEWAQAFTPIIIPILFMPWKYVFKTYVLGCN